MEQRPHILHVINGLARGGAETALLRLVQDTAGSARHTIVSLTGLDRMRQEFERVAGVQVILLHGRRGIPDPRLSWRCAAVIRSLRPDVLHAWLPLSWMVTALARVLARAADIPMVWSARSTIQGAPRRPSEAIALRLCRATSGWCDALIANSHLALRQLREFGYGPRSSHVVHNGVDVRDASELRSLRSRMRTELGILDSGFVLLFLGRVHPDKGASILMETIEHVRERAPGSIFWRVGRDAAERDRNPDTVRLQTCPFMHHFGEVADPTPHLAAADALIVTSERESCPNAVLEAMSAGLPVVSTDVGDVRMILGDAGRVGGRSPHELAQHVVEIARGGPDLRLTMGAIGRERIGRHHARSGVAARYLEIYRAVVDGRDDAGRRSG